MKEPLVCSVCGAGLTEETATEFEGQMMCASCLEAETTLCNCCGERISYSSNHGNDAITLCRRCYENHYTTCEECGALISNNNAYISMTRITHTAQNVINHYAITDR